MALIEVENLKKDYETGGVVTSVLHGIDFSMEKGEFVAIMGPSGSGKSTLMHILSFLDTPSSTTSVRAICNRGRHSSVWDRQKEKTSIPVTQSDR